MTADLKQKWIVPSPKDPRWILLGLLIFLAFFIMVAPSSARVGTQLIAAVLAGMSVEYVYLGWIRKVPLFPVSGLITSFGLFTYTDSPHVWPYALVVALGIGSKHLIRLNDKHIFNPGNFAIVVMVLFFGDYMTVASGGRFGGYGWLLAFAVLPAALVAIRAYRHWISLAYVLVFILGLFFRSWYLDVPLAVAAAPLSSVVFYLFIFLMLTDPPVTPSTLKGQVAFGAATGVLDLLFRLNQEKYAGFYALFIMTSVYVFIKAQNFDYLFFRSIINSSAKSS